MCISIRKWGVFTYYAPPSVPIDNGIKLIAWYVDRDCISWNYCFKRDKKYIGTYRRGMYTLFLSSLAPARLEWVSIIPGWSSQPATPPHKNSKNSSRFGSLVVSWSISLLATGKWVVGWSWFEHIYKPCLFLQAEPILLLWTHPTPHCWSPR